MTQAHDLPGPVSYRAILHAALDGPLAERRCFLIERLPAGPELDEAIELVEQADHVGSFLERPRERTAEPYRPALPETIGDYRVLRLLGFGSNGVVYLAQQSAPNRAVALKLLRMDQATGDGAERFEREVALLARLSHPGIAPVFASGVIELGHGRQPWFAMEFVDGAPLNAYADEAGLDARARVELMIEVTRAVAYAHAQGVVHRDLKPENVLVLRESSASASRVRVLDFGVARLVSDTESFCTLTSTGQVVGTLSYMAPEQARGGVIDARADQFALGAILFELLTGELPLAVRGRSTIDALRIVADGEATSVSRYAPALAGDLEAILGMALASEPNRRYPSATELADDLERWLAGRPTVARPPVALGRLVKLVRRHPLATLVGTALLFLGGIVATVIVDARLDEARARRVAAWFEDLALVARLEESVDTLWPIHSTRVAAMEGWLRDASGLESRLDAHRAALAALTSSASFPGSIATQGEALIARIQGLLALGGPVDEIRERCARAAALLQRTVAGRANEWAAARERVALNPQYDGHVLAPEEGLVPIGPDPDSGLEEFAAFETGEVPARSLAGEAIRAELGGALIFVLIPGGDQSIGFDRAAHDFHTLPRNLQVDEHLGPPFVARLAPYYISKFELTQGQYERIAGSNPSYNCPGKTFFSVTTTALHPAECFSWIEGAKFMGRYQLAYPTEAQWEVAARAGSDWIWGYGASPSALHGAANFMASGPGGEALNAQDDEDPDGYWEHAPVGSFRPNAYGMHDMLGNVLEFCRDDYKVRYHRLEHMPDDALVINDAPYDGEKSLRGGSAFTLAVGLQVYHRFERVEGSSERTLGARPVWIPASKLPPLVGSY